MEKILCPTDFSKAATNAVEFAALIAERTGAALTLLHVIHLPLLGTSETAMSAGEILEEHKRHATEKLQALIRYLSEKHPQPLQINYLVKEALFLDAVERMVKKEGHDFVVIGSTGGSNTLEEIMIGSNTEGVIERVKCPVLTVPNKAVPAPFHRIVYASDYQPEDPPALREVLAFARLFNAQVEIVHVSEDASDEDNTKVARFEQNLRAALPEYNLAIHQVVHPDEVEGMKGYLTTSHADLLAIMKKRHGFFHNLFKQSFSEQLTYQSKLPMLIIHE